MTSLKRLVTLVMCCVKLTISTSNEPCLTTYQISEWKRSVAYTDTNGMCDSFLYEGWYRVTSGAGEMMPTECPKWGFRCGTVNPLYLSREGINDTNEQLFPIGGETVERVACMADMHGNCCKDRIHIKIKNCGMYFVYYLKPTTSCPSAYCFGENLPCPEGESSENGFSPGCGTYPNVTVPSPLVTTGLYEETYPNQDHNNAMYSYHTVQFQCNTNLVSKYTYDVRWYIDDFEITEAAHTNVSDKNLAFTTMLKQHHWEYMFKPNMMVQCSIQVREVSLSSPGLKSYSEKFFAGIIVDQNHFEIKEGEETTINISVTIPIGCSYPTENPNIEKIKNYVCILNLLAGVPTYQFDPDEHCTGDISDDALVFATQKCGIFFNHTDWEHQEVLVTGATDNMVNVQERLTVLQFYHDADASAEIKELHIWKGFMLPEIKFVVMDTDQKTLGSTCQSNNDPHMVTFDGKRYELQKDSGEYVMYQHAQLPIRIHSVYQRCNKERALCNCGAAVRSGDSLFLANFCNGNRYVKQFICDENDITVTEKTNGHGYFITVPSGTRLDISMGQVYHFYGINHFHLKGSTLDYGLTKGICGTYNGKTADDFLLQNGDQNSNANIFAESWRLKERTNSLFNEELPPMNFNAREYCTCKKNTDEFPFGNPEFACNLTTALQPCRQQTQSSVYNGRCKRVTHESRKESLKYMDDEEPDHIEIPLNDSISGGPDMDWKNQWTQEKAFNHCQQAFVATTSFAVGSDNVPSVPSDNFINDCVLDIQITGDTQWVDVSTDNYASACLGELAMKMENLTQANATEDGSTGTIFDMIASSTCPKNCSGNGICNNGQCNCTDGFFGSDCSLEKSQAPVLALDSFNGVCDTSLRSCLTYIVPGINFLKGNLFCRFRPFTIILTETVDAGITEEIPGKYFGPFYMHCPAPASRRKRSITDEGSVLGYRLSVSNDGRNFTEELTILIYNTQCLYCNITSMECKELDTCPASLEPEAVMKSDSQTVLIVGLCVGFATLCVLLGVVVIIRKRSDRIKKEKYKVKKTDKT